MIENYLDHTPQIHPDAWVHPAAVLIGEVSLGAHVNVWPGCVLRGDQGSICIGEQTNLQDGVIVHATGGISVTQVGDRVTVGHRAILHGCRVESDVLVGMGSILMDNCVIGTESIVAAGSVVLAGTVIPARSLVAGTPARVLRSVSDSDVERWIHHGCSTYLRLAREHRTGQAEAHIRPPGAS